MTLKTFMKHKHVGVLGVLVLTLSMSGCSTTNSALAKKTSTVEYYRIFDIKTTASRQAVGKAATDGLTKNVNSASTAMPIPSSGEIPQQPGRFKLVNPFDGPRMATLNALMSLSGGAAGPTRVATSPLSSPEGVYIRYGVAERSRTFTSLTAKSSCASCASPLSGASMSRKWRLP